jgi:hypothetical protein
LAGSLDVSTHVAPHIIRGAAQPSVQTPEMQLDPLAQAVPHAPQLFASFCVSTQTPSHATRPPGHIGAPSSLIAPSLPLGTSSGSTTSGRTVSVPVSVFVIVSCDVPASDASGVTELGPHAASASANATRRKRGTRDMRISE